MRKVVVWSASVVLFATPAVAQVQVGGFVEYDNITYFTSSVERKINGRNQGILQLNLRDQVNANAEIFGSVEIRNDQADRARDRIYLDEAYISLYIGSFDVRVGKQIYAWGRADAFNPTDNLTVWDYSDVLDIEDEKIGVLSSRIDYYFGNWTVEGVLVPSFTPTVLPDPSSRWWPSFPADIPNPNYPLDGNPILAATYANKEPVLPDEGIESTQYAVRLTGRVSGWDFSFSWFDGYDDLPGIHTSTTIDSAFTAAEITVEPRYHRRRAIGADFATTVGRIGVRGEAAYYLTDDWDGVDPAIDDPYVQYVIGLDYTFRNVLRDRDLFVLVEWVHELQVPDKNTKYLSTDLNHAYRKSLIGKADLDVGEFTKVTVEGVFNVYADDWWVRPGLEWSLTDGVELSVKADLLGGPTDSFFGTFRDNRRVHLRLKYSY